MLDSKSFEQQRRFMRYQYLLWNALGVILIYIVPDSNAHSCDAYYQFISHFFQLISIIAFFISHYSNPGKIIKSKPHHYPIPIDPVSYCNICCIVQASDAKHCKKCDFCVMEFDHHCDIVGNCIGKYNHKYYKFFLITQFITVFMAFYISFYNLFGETYFKQDQNMNMNMIFLCLRYTPIYWLPLFWIESVKIIVCTFNLDFKQIIFDCDNFPEKSIWHWICHISLFVGLLVALVFLFGLLLWHFYLFIINKTTYQTLKGNKKRIKTDHSEAV